MKLALIFLLCFLMSYCSLVCGQSSTQNYISVHTKTDVEGTTEQVEIQYYDGLGRPLQRVLKHHTSLGKDLIYHTDYDYCGRVAREWLPTPVGNNQGGYIASNTFSLLSKNYYADGRPYIENFYSTRYRYDFLEKIQMPGDDMGNHSSSLKHLANDSNQVRKYVVNVENSLECVGYYEAKSLECFHTIDEDGKINKTFKDRSGNVILEMADTVRTYHVYNSLGQKCYVLPAKVSDRLTVKGVIDDEQLEMKQYAFIYKYDEQGNCISKQLPGCAPIYMVYDKSGRMIFTQDGNQRLRQLWMRSGYDVFGRLLYMGECSWNTTLESAVDTYKNRRITDSFTTLKSLGYSNALTYFSSHKLLIVNYYDDYRFLDLLPSVMKDSLSYKSHLDYGTPYISAKGLLTGTRIYLLDGSGKYTVKVFYYDEKEVVVQTRSSNFLGGYNLLYVQSDFCGKPLKEFRSSTASTNKTRPVQEFYAYAYDSAGRLLTTAYQLNSQPSLILVENVYDELGCLSTIYRHNRTDTVAYSRNIRGWITRIKSGSFEENIYYNRPISSDVVRPCYNGNISCTTWTYGRQTNGYAYYYNSLNRLSNAHCCLNESWMMDGGQFSEHFTYDQLGNILRLVRIGGGDVIDDLSLSYEGNQLKKVTDSFGSSGLYDVKEYHDKSNAAEEYSYDSNGNLIKDLDRDIVTICYNALNLADTVQFKNGNQLIYTYDASGRLLSIRHFTLAHSVVVPIGETRQWEYEPDFVEEEGIFYSDHLVYNYNGCDPDIYMLDKIYTSEGYVTEGNTNYPRYYYYCKDHLGSNREVWCAAYSNLLGNFVASTVQRIQYYPSGLPWEICFGSDVQNRKYNGQEFVEMHGYDQYDYVARGMYPAIMRFTTIDPMAEKYYNTSPYGYCLNNPINAIDPGGRLVIFVNGMHHGAEGASPAYWSTNGQEIVGFDTAVQAYFEDWNSIYYDGSLGGSFGIPKMNYNPFQRANFGYDAGAMDAAFIIAGLERNDKGEIMETIKVITHSMGAAYAKGLINAIADYAKQHPELCYGLRITEYDFAPFQPTSQRAVKGVRTFQYSHSKDWIANPERMPGAEYMDTSSDRDQRAHSIGSFYDLIKNLPEGEYEFVNGMPVKVD